MKQIISFKKDLPFKTKVSEITSISLEREIYIEDDGIVSGVFHITGDYKMNEGSINRENFSFDLPFDITLDPRYDIKTVISDIEDFYYNVLNEDTLKVNIDLFVEAEYLPEKEFIEEDREEVEEKIEEPKGVEIQSIPDEVECDDRDTYENKIGDEEIQVKEDITEEKEGRLEIKKIEPQVKDDIDNMNTMPALAADLFSNLDDTETYTTYYVYIVKEDDTIDKILTKYGVSKEDLELYNNISEIKPGDKVIVPKTNCE